MTDLNDAKGNAWKLRFGADEAEKCKLNGVILTPKLARLIADQLDPPKENDQCLKNTQ